MYSTVGLPAMVPWQLCPETFGWPWSPRTSTFMSVIMPLQTCQSRTKWGENELLGGGQYSPSADLVFSFVICSYIRGKYHRYAMKRLEKRTKKSISTF